MSGFDDFLATLDGRRAAALTRILEVARSVAPEATEGKSYGMNALRYAGKPLIGLTASIGHLSLHPFSPAVVAAVADDLPGLSKSKGTIRFTPESPVPDAVVERIVRLRKDEIDRG